MPRRRNRGRVENPLDPEIERTFRQRRRRTAQEREGTMGANRPLRDFACPTYDGTETGILAPRTEANNFEIKPAIMAMIKADQFGGHPSEDPVGHLEKYLEILSTFKMNGVSSETIRLTLFTFSLRDRAKVWQRSLPPAQITSWAELVKAFLTKFFPSGRTAQFRSEITQFKQLHDESIYDAWERYRELIRKCPHHGLQKWLIIEMFYNGLDQHHKSTIDSAAGGSLMAKNCDEAYDLISEIADNSYQWHSDRSGQVRRPIGASSHESAEVTALKAQISGLTNQLKHLSVGAIGTSNCQVCGDPHLTNECQLVASMEANDMEQVNYVQNQFNRQQNNPFSNTYNPGWRSHPNFYGPINKVRQINLEVMRVDHNNNNHNNFLHHRILDLPVSSNIKEIKTRSMMGKGLQTERNRIWKR